MGHNHGGSKVHHQVNRCSSIYSDLASGNLSTQFDFDFGFDLDTEKGLSGTSTNNRGHGTPSLGSEAALKNPRESVGEKLERTRGGQYIVFWDGPYDAANPQNWSYWRKWTAVMIVSSITIATSLASSMVVPALPQVSAELHNTSEALSSFVISVYLLGFGIGPPVLSPLSELWGRNVILNITNALFAPFTVACALSISLSMLIGFRFVAGCAGSAALTIGGGTIADVMPPEKRGKAMAIFAMSPLLGPSLGPVAGGFLSQAAGRRWVFRLLAILAGLMTILTLRFHRETYAPMLLRDKAKKMQKKTGEKGYKSRLEKDLPVQGGFFRAIMRPLEMLLFSPVILGLCSLMALAYAYIYLLFTTFPLAFQTRYRFSTGIVGLAYLGMSIGVVMAAVAVGYISDRQVAKMAAKSGYRKPEDRLPIMVLGGPLIAAGLFCYGWSYEARTHWFVPIIGTVPIGAGVAFVCTPLSTYIIDAFTTHAASALAATTVLRSILSALLPLAAPSMYESLDFGWGNSLLAFIVLAFGVIPLAFYRYGESLRERYPLTL